MKTLTVFLVCLLAVCGADAQTVSGRQIQMSAADCRKISSVPAAYTPGVSTTGQAVAPADLGEDSTLSTTGQTVAPADLNGGYQMAAPDLQTLNLPVTLDLEKNFPFWGSSLDFGTIPVAEVEVRGNQIFVNGHLISDNGLSALKQACSSAEK